MKPTRANGREPKVIRCVGGRCFSALRHSAVGRSHWRQAPVVLRLEPQEQPTRSKFTGSVHCQGLKSAHRLFINHRGKKQTHHECERSCHPRGEGGSKPATDTSQETHPARAHRTAPHPSDAASGRTAGGEISADRLRQRCQIAGPILVGPGQKQTAAGGLSGRGA